MKILIIEDELALAENLHTYLSKGGLYCESACNCQDAKDKLKDSTFDIIVLDLMLPDGSGLDLLRLIKQESPEAGILIISARNGLEDKVTGLELGADDYLTKPFHLPELNARIKALIRRKKFSGHKEIIFEEFRIDTDTMECWVTEKTLPLTVKEYELLLFFIANRNRVITKQSIAEHLWGDNVDFLDSFDFVYQHIKNLRKKITAAGGNDYIKTIYGLGYKFNGSKI